jgi:hypothetical protein
MKTLVFSVLILLSGGTTFAQEGAAQAGQAPAQTSQAPPAVDAALRARVERFYSAFIAGKFKEAYALVADDSQDKFFELSKDEYKSCEILKINYSNNFAKATVVTTCKSDWRWHGAVTLTTFPLTSTWVVVDGQWYWHYERPSMVPTPFSPTGFVPLPPESTTDNAGLVPKNLAGAAQGILSKIGIDKSSVHLRSGQRSQEVIHLRNDMPGEVSVTLDQPSVPGLNVSIGQSKLHAHEETAILVEWNPSDPAVQCRECASRTAAHTTVRVHIDPTGQVFPISVVLDNGVQDGHPMAPQSAAPAQPANSSQPASPLQK